MKFALQSMVVVICSTTVITREIHFGSLKSIADQVNRISSSWEAGGAFATLQSPSSVQRLLGNYKRNGDLPVKRRSGGTQPIIPLEFDSRERWPECPLIGRIYDQGNCASGWAIAAAGVFSDRLCIRSGGRFSMPLSSEELLACADEDEGTACGSTVSPESAWEFLHGKGIVTGGGYNSSEGCQPYETGPCDHSGNPPSSDSLAPRKPPRCFRRCTNPDYHLHWRDDHHRVGTIFSIWNDPVEIQNEIYTNGPVEAVIYVFADFPTYQSGVYRFLAGELLGEQAVRLVGWGQENGTHYWLAANSWGSGWGEAGFFRIAGHQAGVEDFVSAAIPYD